LVATARHDRRTRNRGERPEAFRLRLVHERCPAVDVQAVEEEWRQRELRPEAIDVQLAAEPLHRPLEGFRRAIGTQRDHLTVENHLPGWQPSCRFHDFGTAAVTSAGSVRTP